MSKITTPHDTCFQQFMQSRDNAQNFFQHYLDPQLQQAVDLDTLELQSGSSITSEGKKRHTDILYRVNFRHPENQGNAAYLYTIVEHQSTPDLTMALRLLQYKVSLLLRHVNDPYLPPIHSMVFYHGQKSPYPYNLDLRTSFHTPEHAEHTLQGPPQLIDIPQQPDSVLLRQDRTGLFSYFLKHVRDSDVLPALMALPADFLRKITQHPSGIMLLETLMRYYQTSAITSDPLKAYQEIANKLDPQQQEHIMNMGEALRAEGRQEGMERGIFTVAQNMLQAGTAPQFIEQVTGLSSDDIQKMTTQ